MTKNEKSPSETPSETPSFEQSLARLEEIVHSLEEGELGLSEALARYEEGVKLLRQSYDLLQQAQRKIELLSGVDAEGNPVTRPLEDVSTLAREQHERRRTRRPTEAE